MPNIVTAIGYRTFAGAKSLKSITLPDSVISIGTQAFAWCQLSSINLGNNVENINELAFAYNDMLSIYFPESLISVGRMSFYDC